MENMTNEELRSLVLRQITIDGIMPFAELWSRLGKGQKAIEAIDVINDRLFFMKAHFTFEEKVVRIGLILERYYKGEEKDNEG